MIKTLYISSVILLLTNSLWAQQALKNEEKIKGIYHTRYREDSTRIRLNAKLEIKDFYSYHFMAGDKDMNCRLSMGNWTVAGDTLMLVSYPENQLPEKYQFQTLFCKWRDFKKSRFLIKNNKLIALYRNRKGKWKRGKTYKRK